MSCGGVIITKRDIKGGGDTQLKIFQTKKLIKKYNENDNYLFEQFSMLKISVLQYTCYDKLTA